VKGYLRDNPDLAIEVENQLREAKDLPLLEVPIEDEQATQEVDS
jgi:hypothetical protein